MEGEMIKEAVPFDGLRGQVAATLKRMFKDKHISKSDNTSLRDYHRSRPDSRGYYAVETSRGDRVVGGPLSPQAPTLDERLLGGLRWNDKDSEARRLIGIQHELAELTSRRQRPVFTHNDIDVLAREGNFIRSLRQAGYTRPTNRAIRARRFTNLSGEEAAIREVFPWYRHGETRLNRREIDHLSDVFKQRGDQILEKANRSVERQVNQLRAGILGGGATILGGGLLAHRAMKSRRAIQGKGLRRHLTTLNTAIGVGTLGAGSLGAYYATSD